MPLELEGRFSIELSDEETGRTHTLAGHYRPLDKDPESDTYEIIDYKTGKKNAESGKCWRKMCNWARTRLPSPRAGRI